LLKIFLIPKIQNLYIKYSKENAIMKKNERIEFMGSKSAQKIIAAAIGFLCISLGAGFCVGIGFEAGKNFSASRESVFFAAEKPNDIVSFSPALLAFSSADAGSGIVDIVKRASGSIVSINVESTVTTNSFWGGLVERKVTSAGSGVIFHEDAEKIYIITNFHVINRANAVSISIDDERQAAANYIGSDRSEDLAVISVSKTALREADIRDYSVAVFGDSHKLEVGELVVAIGNAIGDGKSATAGIVSALNRNVIIDGVTLRAIQTDASINPGNSGGALVNSNAEVIGINTAKVSGNGIEGMGYSIPIATAQKIAAQIMNGGTVKKPVLGISGSNLTREILNANRHLNLPESGVLVEAVFHNSAAAHAGLRANDIIVAINGKSVATMEELIEEIQRTGVGGEANLKILRRFTEEITVKVTVRDANAGANF